MSNLPPRMYACQSRETTNLLWCSVEEICSTKGGVKKSQTWLRQLIFPFYSLLRNAPHFQISLNRALLWSFTSYGVLQTPRIAPLSPSNGFYFASSSRNSKLVTIHFFIFMLILSFFRFSCFFNSGKGNGRVGSKMEMA